MKLILRKKKEFVSHFQQSVLNQRHPDWVEFIAAFFESASTQMLKDPTDKHLFIQVKRSWDFFQGHQGNNKPVIHYHVDTEHQRLCLDIIQKDQPFIIETLKNAFHYHALTSDIIFHPVFKVKRDVKGNLLHIISKESKNPADYSYESLISCEIHWKGNEQEAKAIIDDIEWRLNLIHLTVDDWPKMRKIIQTSYSKKQHPESDYFDWLFHDNFLFLGLRTIETSTDKTTIRFPRTVGSLGIFKDDVLAQNKNFKGTGFKPTKKSLCFHMTKTHIRSPINRPARVDMIEFFDEQKNVTHQMIGIFTRRSYTQSNFKIPIIKTKAEHVFDQFGLRRNWHDGKMLVKALESIPHDEYWHFSQDDLYTLCDDVLSFHELSLPTYIAQLSEDKSSLTMIVFIGRDRYSMDLKKKMGDFLANHLNGQLSSVRGIIDDSPFARFIYVVSAIKNSWRENGLKDVLEELSLSWNENRHKLCLKHHGTDTFIHTFDGNYQKDFTPEQALFDSSLITTTNSTHTFALNATFSKAALEKTFQSHLDLRVMRFEQSVVLSTLMDVLQNFGITVNQEKTYVLEGGRYYLHDCLGNIPQEDLSKETITRLEGSIVETLSEKSPNDPFNKLIIYADFSPKEVHLFRSYAEYMQQIKHPYGFHFIANSLAEFPGIAKSLLTLFKARFDPHGQKRDLKKIFEAFEDQLMTVESSAQDALFRDMKNMVQATLRTNFFLDRPYISLKFSCELIDALPEPKPLYEVFVSSPLMQGIHLRSSKIARGGIRYSDRPHDFRSEVLQLMQAQNLKNAIIVPTGAKGGFILKKRNPSKEDVLEAYKTLICGLLDLADNRIQGKEWHNPGTVAYDDFDPYLVVAADKGTATFSDTANNLATDYNFWLGDAFASGGSHGYDHKQLGITAKGA
ncbi:MAG: NAD-glutamate dehydrogenase, partial [Alphaproteobacteria bacterium]|nr:NAD-glutamate dehydrogenase [Alphaproteobacteria bacterium]